MVLGSGLGLGTRVKYFPCFFLSNLGKVIAPQ